jgi:iron complex outermembrane receptor protein
LIWNELRGSWGNYNYKCGDSKVLSKYLLRETDLSNGVANVLETYYSRF